MDKIRAYKWFVELAEQPIAGLQVIELLGHGKSAIVVSAQRGGEKPVALKIFDPEVIERFGLSTQLVRIEREKKLIGVEVGGLVRVLDGGFDEVRQLLYVVMELLPKEWSPLSKKLLDVPRTQVWPLISQIAQAARALEQMSIAHRDIKPDNIMVSPDCTECKLMDLGVIKPIGGESITDEHARPFIGTLQYGPPELLLRNEEDSVSGWRAVTFYQLGGVLHDLIMRKPLFQEFSEPYPRLALAVQDETPAVVAPDVHPDLVVLCRGCLVKSPSVRLECVGWDQFQVSTTPPDESQSVRARERVRFRRLSQSALRPSALEAEQHSRLLLRMADQALNVLSEVIRGVVNADKLPPVSISAGMTDSPGERSIQVWLAASIDDGLDTPTGLEFKLSVLDAREGICKIEHIAAPGGVVPAIQIYAGPVEHEVLAPHIRDLIYLTIDKRQQEE